MNITISIVEDDEALRESMIRYFTGTGEIRCLGSYGTAEEALQAIPQNPPDVVLMDINLPQMSGIQCVAQLKLLLPKLQVVMLTVYEDTDQVYQALAAGACGYLVKRASPEEILSAVKEVFQGGAPMSSHIARKVVQSFQSPPKSNQETGTLSHREQEVLNWLARGYSYKQIADTMSLSLDTVRTYIRRIYDKLHVRTRTEAVVKFLQR